MKKMTVQEVIEYLNNDESGDDFAFRGDDFVPGVGGKYNNSCYHGDDADEFELDGVSAINITSYRERDVIKAIGRARMYGENVVLLRGYQTNSHEWANDPDECLIQNNQVVCVINAKFEKTGSLDWNEWRVVNA